MIKCFLSFYSNFLSSAQRWFTQNKTTTSSENRIRSPRPACDVSIRLHSAAIDATVRSTESTVRRTSTVWMIQAREHQHHFIQPNPAECNPPAMAPDLPARRAKAVKSSIVSSLRLAQTTCKCISWLSTKLLTSCDAYNVARSHIMGSKMLKYFPLAAFEWPEAFTPLHVY